ncbi:MAG: formate dehydrogenase accessory sulfurtransferase FdhD [Acidobacteriaceae bacterium]|nr:formate dehydrogenase accessory sulfurtransferase FdhD [Acidobacteriaceae bacterium]MBV9444121.1 formate dehydrogenase accessory sulfurtransferase FdhD [Acidobacteriaceae bacterium]
MDRSSEDSLTRLFSVKRIGNNAEMRDGRVLDIVAVEEPLDIRIAFSVKQARLSQNLALTMRTPGADRELAAGFLLSEGVVRVREDIVEIRELGIAPSNEIVVELAEHVDFDGWRLNRNTVLNSSCGICGKRSIESLTRASPIRAVDKLRLDPETIRCLPDLLREWQEGFSRTGGLHAAALVAPSGNIVRVFEDIGRHNALDKLLGWAFLDGMVPLIDHLLFMSSRSSFELVAKAAAAGSPVLATVGGPSSLAIETARALGVTLLGFVRDNRFNVYSGEWRINS